MRLFNNDLESGLRTLFLLAAHEGQQLDLQRLVFLDYLLVHSGDVTDGPPSLHAPVPYRSAEWLVRRNTIASGLDLLFAKDLLAKSFDSQEGIRFSATDISRRFLDIFASEYADRLKTRAEWVANEFGDYSDQKLQNFMISKLGEWGAEFTLSEGEILE